MRFDLLEGEKILSAERRHWLEIVYPVAARVVVTAAIIGAILFSVRQSYSLTFLSLLAIAAVIVLPVIGILSTVVVMDWYYNFYIITNQRLIIEHFFSLGGPLHQEAFVHDGILNVDIKEKNILYDLFHVQDVRVDFASTKHRDPFVFRAPRDAGTMIKILEGFIGQNDMPTL
jgi:hypothetical protein